MPSRSDGFRLGGVHPTPSSVGSTPLRVNDPTYDSFSDQSEILNLKSSISHALCPLPNPQSPIRNPHSAIRIPQSHLGLAWFLQFKKTTKIRINSQTRIKHISFKFMYVTVLLVKIICYSFL